MLKTPSAQQTELEMVSLESLVPSDHLLRKIDAVIDFSFIHDRVAGLYCADFVDKVGCGVGLVVILSSWRIC